jgi:6-phosphogluconate dehydrogenase
MLVYDLQPQAVSHLVKEGSLGADSFTDCLKKLNPPRVAWMLAPAACVDQAVQQLTELMAPDDSIIGGGNSYYQDSLDHRLPR